MIPPKVTGIILIVLGLQFVFATKLYLTEGWRKISSLAASMPPEKYKHLLRIWGAVLIAVGCYFMFKH